MDNKKPRKIVLASNSPRRIAIFEMLNIPFIQVSPEVSEKKKDEASPEKTAIERALMKAKSVSDKFPENPIIGIDTIVIIDHKVLGKPEDEDDARRMLRMLSGRLHSVVSAIGLVNNGQYTTTYDKTFVRFRNISDEEIINYIKTGEPMDKAGAYAVQGKGAIFIEEIFGDFYNIMGIPITKLYSILIDIGINPMSSYE